MSEARTDTTDRVDFLASVPQHLVDSLQAEAKEKVRSRNAQLIFILQERYADATPPVAVAPVSTSARRRKTA